MKKKIIALCLIIALAATAVIGGTLAYFTDTDAATNTFTVGNVSIRLIESTYHREGNDNSGDTSIPDPQSTASGMNYVADGHKAFTDAEIQADAEGYQDYLAERGTNMVPGKNAAKCPYVINTGNNHAYIRIRVLVPSAANNDRVAVADGGIITNQWCSTSIGSGEFAEGKALGWSNAPYFTPEGRTIDGVKYDVYTFVRNKPLAPRAMTEWNVWNFIGIHEDATAEQINRAITNNTFDVRVEADAIQAEGFASATEAWAAFAS